VPARSAARADFARRRGTGGERGRLPGGAAGRIPVCAARLQPQQARAVVWSCRRCRGFGRQHARRGVRRQQAVPVASRRQATPGCCTTRCAGGGAFVDTSTAKANGAGSIRSSDVLASSSQQRREKRNEEAVRCDCVVLVLDPTQNTYVSSLAAVSAAHTSPVPRSGRYSDTACS
jgi:hypothetical protein